MSRINLRSLLLKDKIILAIYVLLAIIISIQLISLGKVQQFSRDQNDMYTAYNNYVIFKYSFLHLISGEDMYIWHKAEHFDLFKYSPSFGLFMGLFAYLPDWLGLPLWNILNAAALFFAIRLLPFKKEQQSVILILIVVELVTSMQNSQSNALLAALMIGAFGMMNRNKYVWASLFLVLATFMKIYGCVGFALFLLYPDKLRAFLFTLLWALIVFFAPLLVTDMQTLMNQYVSWGTMMAYDQSVSYGLSVMGWLNKVFGLVEGKEIVLAVGMVLFFVPFVRVKMYREMPYRLLMLSFILIWVIIFNHKAESATFIIAMCGIATWYFVQPGALWRKIVLGIAFVLVSLSATDLFGPVRQVFTERYAVKPFACIAVWLIVFYELMTISAKKVMSGGGKAITS